MTGLTYGSFFGFKFEFLAANGRLVHQSTFSVSEHHHAFVVTGFGLSSGSRTCSGTRRGAFGPRFGLYTGGYRHRRSRRIEFEFTTGELIVGAFVFKEYHLTEGLSTQLKTDSPLNQRGFTGDRAALINLARAIGAA